MANFIRPNSSPLFPYRNQAIDRYKYEDICEEDDGQKSKDFNGAKFAHDVSFQHEDMQGYSFVGALLPHYLSCAKMQGANLENADFNKANATYARFEKANLKRAKMQGTNLTGAKFQLAQMSGADLKEANLTEAKLARADLSEAQMSGAELRKANLQEAKFQSANLYETIFGDAQLQRANLKDLASYKSWFNCAQMQGVNLQGASFQRDKFGSANLEGACFNETNACWVSLERANLKNAFIIKSTFHDEPYLEYPELCFNQETDLRGAIIIASDFRGASSFKLVINENLEGTFYHDVKFPEDFGDPKEKGMIPLVEAEDHSIQVTLDNFYGVMAVMLEYPQFRSKFSFEEFRKAPDLSIVVNENIVSLIYELLTIEPDLLSKFDFSTLSLANLQTRAHLDLHALTRKQRYQGHPGETAEDQRINREFLRGDYK